MRITPPMNARKTIVCLGLVLNLSMFLFSGCSKSSPLQMAAEPLKQEQPNIGPKGLDPTSTPAVPKAPTQLTGALETASSVRLSWIDDEGDFASFQIERRVAGTSQVVYFSQNQSSRSYLDTSLLSSTTYEYRVRAINDRGISESSNGVSITTPAPTTAYVPVVPIGVTVAIVGTSIRITWTDNNSEEEGYVLQRKVGTGSFTDLATKPANSSFHVDDAVSVNVAYTYGVKAFRGTVSSDYSSAVSLTIPGTPPVSAATLGIVQGSSTPLTLNLSWQDLSHNETAFIVERKIGTGSFAELGRVGFGVEGFSDSSVQEGNEYSYRVIATNGFGNAAPSNVARVNIPATPQLPSVPSLAGALSTVSPATQIELSWSMTDPNVNNLQLEQKTGGATSFSQIGNLAGSVRSFSVIGLSASTQYIFRVRASNAVGFSAYSTEVSLTTSASSLVLAPSNLQSSSILARRISLVWPGSSSVVSGYEIQRRELSQTQFSLIFSSSVLGSASRSVDDSGVFPSTSYVYQIRAINLTSGQASNWVESATLTTPGDSGGGGGGGGSISLTTPSNLQAVPSRTHITLSWQDNNTLRDGFQILRNDGANETVIGTATTLGYTDTAVTVDLSYRYKVRAYRVVSGVNYYSAYSAEAVTQVLPPPLPAPQFLTASAASASLVNLTWAAIIVSGVKYRVLRSNNLGLSFNVLAEETGLSFQDSTAIPQTTYHYEIVAVKNDGVLVSAPSNILVVTTPAAVCTDCPVSPYDFRAAWSTTRKITLKWSYRNPNPEKFMLYMSLDNQSFSPVVAAGLKKAKRSYVVGDLDPAKTYYFRIAAVKATKLSQYAVTLMTGDISRPAIPTQLTASLIVGTKTIHLSFFGSINTDEFEVYRQRKNLGWVEIKGNLLPNDESEDTMEFYDDTPPVANKEYRYKVRARNSTGPTAFSDETPYIRIP